MKAFLSACLAVALIAMGANWLLTRELGFSSADRTASQNVRLPAEVRD